MNLRQLRRVRWGVRATLTLGVAVSVAANVLHALPDPIAKAIAAWPPLALLLTVELISRVPVHRRSLAAVRLVATAAIAGIAAWVSYWHMAAVAARYGEAGAAPYLLPLSVDGLVVVASVSLVELAGRIRTAAEALLVPAPSRRDEVVPAPVPVPVPAVPAGSAVPNLVRDEPAAVLYSNTTGEDGRTAAVPAQVRTQDEPVPVPPGGTAAVPAKLRRDGDPVAADLLARARAAARAHLAEHGRPITRDELRAVLKTGNGPASAVLRLVRQDGGTAAVPAGRVNGTKLIHS